MFARNRGRGNDGTAGRGFGFGTGGGIGQHTSSNPFVGAAQRFASGSAGLFGAPAGSGAGHNLYGASGLGLGTGAYASTGLGFGMQGATTAALDATSATPPSRPKVALVGTTASAASAWRTLYETGFDVAVVAAGPDAFVEVVDAAEAKRLERAASAFIKGCILTSNLPRELTEEEKKAKEAAVAAAAAKPTVGPPASGTWSFLGTPGAAFGSAFGAGRGGPTPAAAAAAAAETVAAVPEDPALRGVHACAWTQLLTAPIFDAVDVVYLTARAFPPPDKTPPTGIATATTSTTGAAGGALGSSRSVGSARSRTSSLSGRGAGPTGSGIGAASSHPHDGLEAFTLQCIERGKHVVLDVPAAANAASVATYVEAIASAQKPRVCVMDRTAGIWTHTLRFDALRGLCGIPDTQRTETSAAAAARAGRSSSGRRTIASSRLRGRGRGASTSTTATSAMTAADTAAAVHHDSVVGELCQLRLHVCVPRDADADEAEKALAHGLEAATAATDALTRVTDCSAVSAQPGRQLSTAHPLLFHLPLPPPPPPQPAAPASSAAASDVPSTPSSTAQAGAAVSTLTDLSQHEDSEEALALLGVLGDVGYHVISFYLALFDWAMPAGVMASVRHRHPVTEAPTSVEGTLYFRFEGPSTDTTASTSTTTASASSPSSGRRRSLTASRGAVTGATGTAADAEAHASEADKNPPPAPKLIAARFYISNEPDAPLTQRLTVNGTKGTLELPAPLFPLKADLVPPTPAQKTEAETAASTTAVTATTSTVPSVLAVAATATTATVSAASETKEEAPPEPAQSTAHYLAASYTNVSAGALQLRGRSRALQDETLPATMHPDAQLWTALKQVIGLASAPTSATDAGTSTSTTAAAVNSGRRTSSTAFGGGTTTSPSSSYSRYRRPASTLRNKGDPTHFPVQDTELATKLVKSMWMTQQVLDSVRAATNTSV